MLASYQIKDAEKFVYTIDSYQGHEADYVFVSLVRTKAAGFLTNKRRCNVMLTRCQKGMIIFGKMDFVLSHSGLKNSLIRNIALMCQASRTVSTDLKQVALPL